MIFSVTKIYVKPICKLEKGISSLKASYLKAFTLLYVCPMISLYLFLYLNENDTQKVILEFICKY